VSECACIPRDRDGESKIMTQVNCYRIYIYIYTHTNSFFYSLPLRCFWWVGGDENFPTKGRGGLQNLACHILQQGVGSMCRVGSVGGRHRFTISGSNNQKHKFKDSLEGQ
jgi:hypothetical protein